MRELTLILSYIHLNHRFENNITKQYIILLNFHKTVYIEGIILNLKTCETMLLKQHNLNYSKDKEE